MHPPVFCTGQHYFSAWVLFSVESGGVDRSSPPRLPEHLTQTNGQFFQLWYVEKSLDPTEYPPGNHSSYLCTLVEQSPVLSHWMCEAVSQANLSSEWTPREHQALPSTEKCLLLLLFMQFVVFPATCRQNKHYAMGVLLE